jgi:hypothetical protein
MKHNNEIFSKSTFPYDTSPITSDLTSATPLLHPLSVTTMTHDPGSHPTRHLWLTHVSVAETRIVADTILVAALLWLTHQLRPAHDSASDFI